MDAVIYNSGSRRRLQFLYRYRLCFADFINSESYNNSQGNAFELPSVPLLTTRPHNNLQSASMTSIPLYPLTEGLICFVNNSVGFSVFSTCMAL